MPSSTEIGIDFNKNMFADCTLLLLLPLSKSQEGKYGGKGTWKLKHTRVFSISFIFYSTLAKFLMFDIGSV